MGFVGNVNVNVYFGTMYDDVNVPYYSSQIAADATKTLSLPGQVVWQSTWLSYVDLNIDDYQEIVGAQFISIVDDGASNTGTHWFEVSMYEQISRGTVRVYLNYDPLLTIGIGNIAGISGVLQRWTVDEDSPFKWSNAPEPLEQIDDYEYTYFRYNAQPNNDFIKVIGFPHDMTNPPVIKRYQNPDSELTNIFYPDLSPNTTETIFVSSVSGNKPFKDGLQYYLYDPNSVAIKNMDKAIGLGFDLVTNSYSIPKTGLIEVDSSGELITTLRGTELEVASGFELSSGLNLKNQKAKDIGRFFSLYNEMTGDSVTVNAADLSNTLLKITANPYKNGYIAARFYGYMHDITGHSGIVKSVGYQPANMSAHTASGSSLAYMNYCEAVDSVQLNYRAASENNRLAQQREATMYELGQEQRLMSGGINIAGDLMAGNITGALTAGAGVAMEAYNSSWEHGYAQTQYRQNAEHLRAQRDQKIAQLAHAGSMAQMAPPPVKFTGDSNVSGSGYTFVVRLCSLSGNDRNRADKFFTAYGYNVQGTPLDNVSQLHCRSRFTFVQATDVRITSLKLSPVLTRVNDPMTIQYIQDRFAAGLRIWNNAPHLDWSIDNAISGGGETASENQMDGEFSRELDYMDLW